jgi:hypothetical protein
LLKKVKNKKKIPPNTVVHRCFYST